VFYTETFNMCTAVFLLLYCGIAGNLLPKENDTVSTAYPGRDCFSTFGGNGTFT